MYEQSIENFWTYQADDLFLKLNSNRNGLNEEEAADRLSRQSTKQSNRHPTITLLVRQYKNPIILLLVFAAAVSGILQEYSDGIIIIGVLVLMGLFTFIQEWRANKAVNQLQLLVHSSATVLRNSATRDVKISEVVPGDVVLLNAGDIVPADGLLIECKDLHVNESSLTGESYPAEKMPGILSADTALSQRTNVVFEGTSVINGSASFIAVCTGNGSK
jgi:P-type Mg2+ transporter